MLCQISNNGTKMAHMEYEKRVKHFCLTLLLQLVGVTRFELATPRPPDGYATRLRYTPNFVDAKVAIFFGSAKKNDAFYSLLLNLFKCVTLSPLDTPGL